MTTIIDHIDGTHQKPIKNTLALYHHLQPMVMIPELPGSHVDDRLIDVASRNQQVMVLLITMVAALAGLGLLKALFTWLLESLYQLFIQKNIFNL